MINNDFGDRAKCINSKTFPLFKKLIDDAINKIADETNVKTETIIKVVDNKKSISTNNIQIILSKIYPELPENNIKGKRKRFQTLFNSALNGTSDINTSPNTLDSLAKYALDKEANEEVQKKFKKEGEYWDKYCAIHLVIETPEQGNSSNNDGTIDYTILVNEIKSLIDSDDIIQACELLDELDRNNLYLGEVNKLKNDFSEILSSKKLSFEKYKRYMEEIKDRLHYVLNSLNS